MTDGAIQGELQEQIMIVLWHNGEGTVEHVRAGLPARHRSAYSTVQTVLNRLVDRGLLSRERRGKTFIYTAKVTEGQYLSRSIERTLAGASLEARQAALAQLIGTIDTDELSALQEQARQATAAREARRR
ncbi:BlaI/MecI/CopY family transcriptional regulator [Patulibacter sp. NPDC049589]|uniref:BlaI/MecI/CopY family transcriptional regulator n=1 Tax=Patulibacter sp. NPDC049589 TaxID=3154731 RepID=UPI003422DFA0